MKLTPQELQAAEESKLISMLDDKARGFYSDRAIIELEMSALIKKKDALKEACDHPEVAVETRYSRTEDEYGSGYYEDGREVGTYFNHCLVCDKRWAEGTHECA